MGYAENCSLLIPTVFGLPFLASGGPFWHPEANQMDPEKHPTTIQILLDLGMVF